MFLLPPFIFGRSRSGKRKIPTCIARGLWNGGDTMRIGIWYSIVLSDARRQNFAQPIDAASTHKHTHTPQSALKSEHAQRYRFQMMPNHTGKDEWNRQAYVEKHEIHKNISTSTQRTGRRRIKNVFWSGLYVMSSICIKMLLINHDFVIPFCCFSRMNFRDSYFFDGAQTHRASSPVFGVHDVP